MRFNFNFTDTSGNDESQQSLTPSSPATPAEEVQWFPLQNHPLFTANTNGGSFASSSSSSSKTVKNLFAWDGASRLYFWDSRNRCLHRISIRLGEPDPGFILAAAPSKVLPSLSFFAAAFLFPLIVLQCISTNFNLL